MALRRPPQAAAKVPFAKRISENRPAVILVVLVVFSLTSLGSGTEATFISRGVRTAVSLAAHPFRVAFKRASAAVDYLAGLVVSNDALRDENQALRRQLGVTLQHAADRAEVWAETKRLRRMMSFQRKEFNLTLEPVEVIGRSTGTLNINKGSRDGVEELMCVMAPEGGIVGIIGRVGLFESQVLTLHHADCVIGAMIRRNRAHGEVRGSGGTFDYICSMQYIDLKDEVRVGDEVVTSGSGLFPAGYLIGKVTNVNDTGSLLKSAEVQPAGDPYQVDEVWLVRKAEASVRDLAGAPPEQRVVSMGHRMPDDRSLQERFAP